MDTMTKKRQSRHQNQAPRYQPLEPRKMLAGDITAAVANGQLMITGDAEANEVMIIGNGDGSARVVGVDGTTINGGTAEFVTSSSLAYGSSGRGDIPPNAILRFEVDLLDIA